jgi:hypothetical protein
MDFELLLFPIMLALLASYIEASLDQEEEEIRDRWRNKRLGKDKNKNDTI